MSRRLVFLLLGLVFVVLPPAHGGDVLSAADELAQARLRYLYGSESVGNGGLDCSAFTRIVFQRGAQVDLPDEADKQLDYVREHGQVWDATSGWTPDTLRPGDLVFYSGPTRLPRESQISHVMLYYGHGLIVGAQGKGRQLNGQVAGVGYYHFRIRAPQGILGESGDRFVGNWSVFAYGRLTTSAPVYLDPPPVPAGLCAPEAELLETTAFELKPPGVNPRFD